ncbi:MAG: DUF6586 family protein [Ketobacteraceae bacterium]|nr:DUF6586 family protein [Ketobacteraceae bacterium]
MAKHRLSKANQKLYFATIHLDAIQAVQNDESVLNRKAQVQANMEAAIFHLVSAYRGFIWELCLVHDLSPGDQMALSEVIQLASKEGKQIQELNHFERLEAQSESWLAQLLSAYDKVLTLDPQTHSTEESPASFNAIAVRKIEENETPEKIFEWHNALKSEIENFRTTLSEW